MVKEGETRSRPTDYGRVWILYILSGVAFLLVYFLLPLPEEVRVGLIITLGIVNAAVIFTGVRINRPRYPLVWHLFAGSYLAAAAGNTTDVVYLGFSGAIPLPSLSDIFYLGGYALLIAAALVLVRVRAPWGDWTSLVDAAIVATGAAMLSWTFLISPHVQQLGLSYVERFSFAKYPLLDLLLLAVVVRLMVAPGPRPAAYWILVLGISGALVSDTLYSTTVMMGVYEIGSPVEAGWLVAYFLSGVAALHPSMGAVAEPAPRQPVGYGRRRLAVLAAALLLGPAILAVQATTSNRIDVTADVAPIFGGSVVLLLLIATRVEGILRARETALEERRRSEAALRSSEQRLRTIVGNVPIVLFALDHEGVFIISEGKGLKLMGLAQGEPIGQSVFDLYGHESKIAESVRRTFAGEEVTATVELFGRVFESWYVPLWGSGGEVTGVIGVGADVTERIVLEEQLRHQALHDPLTDLPNRTLFARRLQKAQERAKQEDGTVAVLFLDLDNFKVVNDSLGHEAGDRLLTAVARRLLGCCEDLGGMAARLGGDEFVILLDEVAGLKSAERAAENIAESLREPFRVDGIGREIFVTASLGIVLSRSGREEPEELLRRADLAMYKAKDTGKDRHAVYKPSLNVRAHERLGLESDLRRAAERGEMRLHYQPKIHLRTGELFGMEALLRWEHPGRGLLFPEEFIPLAEETGLIVPLERRALREACEQARRWRVRPGWSPLPTVSLNLSAHQFQRPGLVEEVEEALKETGLEPDALILELTETAAMEDPERTIRTLKKLKNLGVGLAIDDFGTGYSSLAHLKSFPVDEIKIDRSTTEGMEHDPGDRAVVAATIMLARAMNLKVVAEGVETADQAQELLSLGCDAAQGYYWQGPSLPENLEEFFVLPSDRRFR